MTSKHRSMSITSTFGADGSGLLDLSHKFIPLVVLDLGPIVPGQFSMQTHVAVGVHYLRRTGPAILGSPSSIAAKPCSIV